MKKNSGKHYDKANSILEIRRHDSTQKNVRERIERLKSKLETGKASDYFAQIVLKACSDLLTPTSDPAPNHFFLRDHVVEEINLIPDKVLERYLFYRYRYDIFPVDNKLDNFPPCLQIEPSSICNYRCVFCYQTDSEFTNPKNEFMGMMDLDLFKRIIDQAEGKVEAITLASRGEPLMSRNIEEMLKYVRGKFLALKLNTNAWFLDEKKSHALLELENGTVVFSADAASEPLYSQLRVNGKLERVYSNIKRFHEIRSRDYPNSKIITRVSGVRYSSKQSLDEMDNVWGKLVDQVAFVDYNPWENVYDRSPNEITAPCSDLWRRMFVWFDGTVNPCDVDFKSTLKVENASTVDLSKIWTGEKYNSYRQKHIAKKRGEMSPCRSCEVV